VYDHLHYLSSTQHLLSTFLQWMWLLVFKARGSAYIVEPVTATDQPAAAGRAGVVPVPPMHRPGATPHGSA
jgi:hypothetical protein